MSITRKQYLEENYKEFIKDISKYIDSDIFPSIDEIEIVDIIFYFNFTFSNITNYEDIVRNLIRNHTEISEEKFKNILYPIIEKYINDLKSFLQKN